MYFVYIKLVLRAVVNNFEFNKWNSVLYKLVRDSSAINVINGIISTQIKEVCSKVGVNCKDIQL